MSCMQAQHVATGQQLPPQLQMLSDVIMDEAQLHGVTQLLLELLQQDPDKCPGCEQVMSSEFLAAKGTCMYMSTCSTVKLVPGTGQPLLSCNFTLFLPHACLAWYYQLGK